MTAKGRTLRGRLRCPPRQAGTGESVEGEGVSAPQRERWHHARRSEGPEV